MKKALFIIFIASLLAACSGNKEKSDAYGTFEATEITVSAENSGKIILFNVNEGDSLNVGDTVGVIDTTQLVLKRDALIAQKKGSSTKAEYIASQIEILKEQKKNSEVEKERIEKMFKDGAATSQQLDLIKGQISVYEKQILSIETTNAPLLDEQEAYAKQIEQVQDMINKSTVINPVKGTVLNKYAEAGEMVVQGKALYKIADLSNMILRVYVSGAELSKIKIGQKVEVLVDKDAEENIKLEGIVTWISSTAEFTPKIIQTKEERVKLVYAVKVRVQNSGLLKIGMPGEVNF
jgi:HlyD family secretion protein